MQMCHESAIAAFVKVAIKSLRTGRSLIVIIKQIYMMAHLTTLKGEMTGKLLGCGSYGEVHIVKVKVNGISKVCAGKSIHKTIIDRRNDGAENIVSKYIEECQLMTDLYHSNITQCHGVFPVSTHRLPILVMEKLEINVHDFLENVPKISLLLKLSILNDVSKGLLYLHTRDPQVIHRDLTATNVLLTGSLVAKITDFGNSRILNILPHGLQNFTRHPGCQLYMPPEASTPCYGPSLDVFSFGHLALFVGNQVFPEKLEGPTYSNQSGKVVAREETERRRSYFDLLDMPPNFVSLVNDCLQNDPSLRPTAEQVVDRLQSLTNESELSHPKADLLIEKISIGKYREKNVLVAGKSGIGKKACIGCLFKRTNCDTQQSEVPLNVNFFTPTNKESYKINKSAADVILLCIRIGVQLGMEDYHVIAHLRKCLGKDFLQRTMVLLTMADQVKPVGAQRNEISHQEFLKAMRDDYIEVVQEAFLKEKLTIPTEFQNRFVLVGAPESSHEERMIPDVESQDRWTDWVQPLGQALLDFSDSMV